jgi:serine/threonine-protein kinase RsbW
MTEDDGRLDLSAPATPEMIELVHAVLEQLWEANEDVAAADRVRFEMAVIEILGNIIEHAYEMDSAEAGSRRFDISVAATETALVASFGDNGLPMSIDLSAVAMPDELAESGRGLALAMAAVDDLSYDREDGRNHWRLSCTRSG